MDKTHELFVITKVKYGKNFLTLQIHTVNVNTVRKIEEIARGKSSLNWTLIRPNEILNPNTIEQINERSYLHQIMLDELLRVSELNLSKIRYEIYNKKPKR